MKTRMPVLRSADDLVVVPLGGCVDCRYRIGDSVVHWRCGKAGGEFCSSLNPDGMCESWQPAEARAGALVRAWRWLFGPS